MEECERVTKICMHTAQRGGEVEREAASGQTSGKGGRVLGDMWWEWVGDAMGRC